MNRFDVGDEKQAIFQFLSADSRYLTKASDLFKSFNKLPWKSYSLQTSFRLTHNIAQFINYHVLQQQLFYTTKNNDHKVLYFRGHDSFKIVERIGNYIIKLIHSEHYDISDILILTPSVKTGQADKQTPLNKLVNQLQDAGYSSHVPSNDDIKVNEKVTKGNKNVRMRYYSIVMLMMIVYI